MIAADNQRHLATYGVIEHLRPIPQADAIEVGSVRGWNVVVKKGEYHDGEPVVFIEPDAALPVDRPAFAFLAARSVKKLEQGEYHVLRTVRLRGQVSQGIVFRPDELRAAGEVLPEDGAGLDQALGILLYEPPQVASIPGAVGPWPFPWLRRTDAERVQNLTDEFLGALVAEDWLATEKVDGTSLTYVLDADRLRVCGRNFELSMEDPASTPVRLAAELKLAELMAELRLSAIQGELYGEGINGNRLKVRGHRLAVFNAWRREGPETVNCFAEVIAADAFPLAPVLAGWVRPTTIETAIAQVDRLKSVINPAVLAEGVVWHHRGGQGFAELDWRDLFKAVNPSYLIKHGL
jgi:RNA ligase (TIGR02306 family)